MWIDAVADPDNYRQAEIALTTAEGRTIEVQARRELPTPLPGFPANPLDDAVRLTFGREADYAIIALTFDGLRNLGQFLIDYAEGTIDDRFAHETEPTP